MSDPHRGAYTPSTDDPLTFDARRPAVAAGRRPFPWALAISILALLIVIGAVFYFYRSGVRAPNGAPQPVGTPVGSITAPAPAEAQPADPAAGLEIYQSAQAPGTPAAPTFAPAPEQPVARPTTPVQTTAIAPAQPAAAPAADSDQPTPQVYVLNRDTGPTGSATTVLNNTAAAPAKPAPVKTVAPKPAPTPAPVVPKTVTPGNFVVQIGAVSSTQLANEALAQAASIAGGGHGKAITPVTVNGATLYRTAVTGFTTKEAAIAYCGKLKAAGKSCFVR